MGAVTGGMSIMNYMENDGQDHLLVHYKMVDDLSDERYRKIFQDLKEEGILINSHRIWQKSASNRVCHTRLYSRQN